MLTVSAAEETLGKQFKTYEEQIELLRKRGMIVDDAAWVTSLLQRVSYYRLSGYWYPFRARKARGGRADAFLEGTTLRDVAAVYDFDSRLRAATLAVLAPIELSVRAQLGHELGRIDPFAHLRPDLLGPTARQPRTVRPSECYRKWKSRYERELVHSHEDFVLHHRQKYGGRLPVWAAVEVLDWGNLTHLYNMAPASARDVVAARVTLTAAQLGSWLKCLNIVRNYAAHHGRMFNRVYTLTPRLPRANTHPELAVLGASMNRAFGQLTLIQYLLDALQVGDPHLLPGVLRTYPTVPVLPLSHLGAPDDWDDHPLWSAARR
ncbi:MAG TPA: Abi family protein [Arachnia sp.]|nr:Abi family protein [Arachnia sp.]HMT85830.1 Abi family protein [Arachnia sp.]